MKWNELSKEYPPTDTNIIMWFKYDYPPSIGKYIYKKSFWSKKFKKVFVDEDGDEFREEYISHWSLIDKP